KEYAFVEPTPIIPDTSRNAYPNVIHSDSIPKVDSIPPRVIIPPVRTERPIVKPRTKKYTVRSGDTLSQIAARNRTTVARIKKANRLRSDRLSIGQVLVIPN
ncbi:MAG: LysM peptidoglycan-binding domain-containing protein, partial [Crocinitomicaceae bacterium]|nr:LysM peptidoglycan-binding domain-containing protein [Crocinitomicaceae bacterium]